MPEKRGRKKADELRKQIGDLQRPAAGETPQDDSEMRPGESPKEYMERRLREGGFKKAPRRPS